MGGADLRDFVKTVHTHVTGFIANGKTPAPFQLNFFVGNTINLLKTKLTADDTKSAAHVVEKHG